MLASLASSCANYSAFHYVFGLNGHFVRPWSLSRANYSAFHYVFGQKPQITFVIPNRVLTTQLFTMCSDMVKYIFHLRPYSVLTTQLFTMCSDDRATVCRTCLSGANYSAFHYVFGRMMIIEPGDPAHVLTTQLFTMCSDHKSPCRSCRGGPCANYSAFHYVFGLDWIGCKPLRIRRANYSAFHNVFGHIINAAFCLNFWC